MPRNIDIRAEVVVLPSRRLDETERSIEVRASRVFVEYPDDTKGSELDNIIWAAMGQGPGALPGGRDEESD